MKNLYYYEMIGYSSSFSRMLDKKGVKGNRLGIIVSESNILSTNLYQPYKEKSLDKPTYIKLVEVDYETVLDRFKKYSTIEDLNESEYFLNTVWDNRLQSGDMMGYVNDVLGHYHNINPETTEDIDLITLVYTNLYYLLRRVADLDKDTSSNQITIT